MTNFFVIYSTLFIDQLYSSTTHRTKQFYKDNPNYEKTLNKIINSIKLEGLRYPLCVYNEKDDNTYRVD